MNERRRPIQDESVFHFVLVRKVRVAGAHLVSRKPSNETVERFGAFEDEAPRPLYRPLTILKNRTALKSDKGPVSFRCRCCRTFSIARENSFEQIRQIIVDPGALEWVGCRCLFSNPPIFHPTKSGVVENGAGSTR